MRKFIFFLVTSTLLLAFPQPVSAAWDPLPKVDTFNKEILDISWQESPAAKSYSIAVYSCGGCYLSLSRVLKEENITDTTYRFELPKSYDQLYIMVIGMVETGSVVGSYRPILAKPSTESEYEVNAPYTSTVADPEANFIFNKTIENFGLEGRDVILPSTGGGAFVASSDPFNSDFSRPFSASPAAALMKSRNDTNLVSTLALEVILYLAFAYIWMRIFKKLGSKKSWFAFVPILNIFHFLSLIGIPAIGCTFLVIPVINVLFIPYTYYLMIKKLGYPNWHIVFAIMPFVSLGYLIFIAFDKQNLRKAEKN